MQRRDPDAIVLSSSSEGEFFIDHANAAAYAHSPTPDETSAWITESYSMDLDRPLHSNFYASPGAKSRMSMLTVPPFIGSGSSYGFLSLPEHRRPFADDTSDVSGGNLLPEHHIPGFRGSLSCSDVLPGVGLPIDLDSSDDEITPYCESSQPGALVDSALCLGENDTFPTQERSPRVVSDIGEKLVDAFFSGEDRPTNAAVQSSEAPASAAGENAEDLPKRGRPASDYEFYKSF